MIKQIQKNIDFKQGDKGVGVLQVHERGLTEDQTKMPGHFGLKPVELTPGQLKSLGQIASEPWQGAIQKAAAGDSSQLSKIVGRVDKEQLTSAQRKLLAIVSPVSIHTDIRMQPDGEQYWEGGTTFTPGNQFKPNKFIKLEEDKKIMASFKTYDDGIGAIRGPLAWMKVGLGKPKIIPPGAVGATKSGYARIKNIDNFKWEAGKQDEHYKEFWFDGKILKGRWIFQYVPVAEGRSEWMISKPKDQEFKKSKIEKTVTVAIAKAVVDKRLVTGVVLEPEVWDADDQIYSADVIEKTAHKFLAEYNKRTKPGVQHNDYTRTIEIVESYITPVAFTLNKQKVKKGSWIMTMKVLDDEIWKMIKKGELTGFSIKGWAVARKVK